MSAHNDNDSTLDILIYWPLKLDTFCLLLMLTHQQIPQNAKYFSPWLIMPSRPTTHSYYPVWRSCRIDLCMPVNSPIFGALSKIIGQLLLLSKLLGEIKPLLYNFELYSNSTLQIKSWPNFTNLVILCGRSMLIIGAAKRHCGWVVNAHLLWMHVPVPPNSIHMGSTQFHCTIA